MIIHRVFYFEKGERVKMSANRQTLNKEINLLYRQLGKEIVDSNAYEHLSSKQKKIIKRIKENILSIETLMKIPENAIILEPEKNSDGLMVYKFCNACKTGNNPNSTHCIHCYSSLS